jgi:multiple sugar transport system substrate-binding protein
MAKDPAPPSQKAWATTRHSLAAALSAALLFSGCGARDVRPSAARPTVVDFWAMGGEGERIQPLIEVFERTNPDLRVRVQQVPWTAAHEKLLTAFAGDSLPDLCKLGNTWIPEYAALGALEDLTVRAERSTVVDAAAYFPGVWAGNVIGDRLFGVPWYVDTRILFYRKDILAAAGHDRPPTSWHEWMRVMRDVKAYQATFRDGADRYATLLPVNEFEQPIIFGMQAGADMLPDNGRRGNFSGPDFRRAFEFYVNIFREGLAPPLANTRISNVWQEFERGTFAMYITGPWNVQEFRQRMAPEMQDKWSTAPLPGPDDQYPGRSTAGGCSLVLFRQARKQDAAWRLAEFLSRGRSQAELFRCTSSLPARKEAWKQSGLLDDPEYAAFHEQLKNVRPAPAVPEWEEIVTGELVKTAEAVIGGRVELDKALADLDRKVDRILEKRRWMLARGALADN